MRSSLFAIITTLLLSTLAYAETLVLTPENLPETITFQEVEMHKVFQDEKDGSFIVEYIPKGEKLENWFYLFAVRKEAFDMSPVERAKGIAHHLIKTNPQFKSQVVFSKETGNAGIDFLIWPEDDSYGEFNSWKFMQGEPGWLYSFQFARRGYTDTKSWDDLVVFMKKKKQTAVREMMDLNITPE